MWTIISSLLGTAWKIAGPKIGAFFSNTKVLIALAILCVALLLYGVYRHMDSKNQDLMQQISDATVKEQQYKSTISEIEKVNKENATTIKLLQKDLESERTVRDIYQKKNKDTEQKMGKLLDFINSAPEEMDGPVAPVLKETIRKIQEDKQ